MSNIELTAEEGTACENTDKHLWPLVSDDAFAPSVHATKDGSIGINVGGHVIVMPIRKWHMLAIAKQREAQLNLELREHIEQKAELLAENQEQGLDLIAAKEREAQRDEDVATLAGILKSVRAYLAPAQYAQVDAILAKHSTPQKPENPL